MMKGKPGKWTGIKSVRVMKATIAAKVPPDLVDRIAPHLSDISRLIEFLRQAVYDLGDPKTQAKRLSGRSRGGYVDDNVSIIELPASRGESSVGYRPQSPESVQANPVRQSPLHEAAVQRSGPPPRTTYAVPGRPQRQVCTSCDGRGGRRGTGWTCPECNGRGRCRQAEIQGSSSETRCRICNGVGLCFAKRGRCRDCGGARFTFTRDRAPSLSPGRDNMYPDTPPPPYSGHDRLVRRQGDT